MSCVYIPCQIKPGMFSNEYAVTVHDANGEAVSYFADHSLVREGPRPLLRVRFVGPTEGMEEDVLVLLPASATEPDRRYINVPRNHVVAA